MSGDQRGSLSLFVVLVAALLGLVAISGGGFLALRHWKQQRAMQSDFNLRR
jgi:hypothetical protein